MYEVDEVPTWCIVFAARGAREVNAMEREPDEREGHDRLADFFSGFRERVMHARATPEPEASPGGRLIRPESPDSLENTPVSIWMCDLEGRVTRVLYSNIHSDPASFVGLTSSDWLRPEDAKLVTDAKLRTIRTGQLVRERISFTLRGEHREYDLIVIPNFDANGKLQDITCVGADITDRLDWLRESLDTPSDAPPVSTTRSILQGFRSLLFPTEEGQLSAPPDTTNEPETFVDEQLHGVRGPGGATRLPRIEWLLLQRLQERRGAVVTRNDLIDFIWGSEYQDDVSLLHDTVSRLRHRFAQAGLDANLIETVHGVGYRLRTPSQ